MEILGYTMALIIGLSLGLIGSGGSILAVPVLAYLFSYDEKIATAYSLFIVGAAALVGGLKQYNKNNVDLKTAIIFGIPAIIGVWLIRHFVIPTLPDVLFVLVDFEVTRRMGMFGLFAILMIFSAYYMIMENEKKRGHRNDKIQLSNNHNRRFDYWRCNWLCRCWRWVSDHPSLSFIGQPRD